MREPKRNAAHCAASFVCGNYIFILAIANHDLWDQTHPALRTGKISPLPTLIVHHVAKLNLKRFLTTIAPTIRT